MGCVPAESCCSADGNRFQGNAIVRLILGHAKWKLLWRAVNATDEASK